MILSKLIVGGNPQNRKEFANQIIKEHFKLPFLKPHPDLLIIEGLNSISIAQVRDLEKKLSLKPYVALLKIAFIHEAEKLTLPAQNALLKTLEEPPGNSLIILTAPQASFLLPTIVSRCQIIRLKAEGELKTKVHLGGVPRSLHHLRGVRVGERLKIAGLHSTDKVQAREFIQQLLLLWRQIMLKEPTVGAAKNIHHIQDTLLMLKRNVNPTLATGNLVLSLV